MHRTCEPEFMDLPDEVDAYDLADFAQVNQKFVDDVLRLAGQSVIRSVLDIGCGPGHIPIALARARPAWQIMAIDASMPMLGRAREHAAGLANLRFVQADAKSPAIDGPFDLIISNSLLHHLPEATGFWRSIGRLSHASTRVLVRDLARPDSTDHARRLVEEHAAGESELLKQEFFRSLLAAFTPAEVRDQLRRAGLVGWSVELITDRHMDIRSRPISAN